MRLQDGFVPAGGAGVGPGEPSGGPAGAGGGGGAFMHRSMAACAYVAHASVCPSAAFTSTRSCAEPDSATVFKPLANEVLLSIRRTQSFAIPAPCFSQKSLPCGARQSDLSRLRNA